MNPSDLPEQMFKRKGVRVAAKAIGTRTPSQQMNDAAQAAIKNDPVMGSAMPQNRIGRYTDVNPQDLT